MELTIQEIRRRLNEDRQFLQAAIVELYRRQEPDERHAGVTAHRNARGFNKFDARFMSSLAEQILNGRELSQRQAEVAARIMQKYARQISEYLVVDRGEKKRAKKKKRGWWAAVLIDGKFDHYYHVDIEDPYEAREAFHVHINALIRERGLWNVTFRIVDESEVKAAGLD